MALSGSFNSYATSQFGLHCDWSGIQNYRTNSTDVTLNVYLRYRNTTAGKQEGVIAISGDAISFVSEEINAPNLDSWTNTLIGTHTTKVAHNMDGTTLGVPLSVQWFFYGTYTGQPCEYMMNASIEIDLDNIPVYKLSTDVGKNSTINLTRTSSGAAETGVITNGALLYNGDRLKISFDTDEGYRISIHTVNGATFTSGGMLIVDEDIFVKSSADVVVKQLFAAENMRCFDTKGRALKTLYQWDKDVAIVIKDVAVSPAPIFQFANRLTRETISVNSFISGEDLVVTIPNVLLEKSENIFAYIYSNSGLGSARTLGSIYIPIRARKKPSGNIYNE